MADFLDELTHLVCRLVSVPTSCSITLRRDAEEVFTVVASDALAVELDEIQYGNGDGPCLESLRTGRIVHVADTRTERRWNGYPRHADRHGARSSLSLPLSVSSATIGALNVYGREPGTFADAAVRETLTVIAAQAASALTMLLRHVQHDLTTAQLEEALNSRTTIDQVIGILMAQQRCTAGQAFALLSSPCSRV